MIILKIKRRVENEYGIANKDKLKDGKLNKKKGKRTSSSNRCDVVQLPVPSFDF